MVVDLLNTPQLIEINSNDEKHDDQLKGELKEEPIEDPGVEQGIKDAGSAMSGDDMSSGSDTSEEPEDEYDWDYGSLRDS